ncbi:MAG: hypothetical protein ASARMPREDX12_007217 [Alectoria sarmentosa]|nr:MAG: hypothetical protein ASARMPREDX12_007217 [Alectoria sarmentosa]CAD6592697.1 MAG: hypothetical protein ASARMPRED_006633 [Alectoria sarmentosa]
MEARECHVVIIGAGLGGLATATAISKAGHKVTLIRSNSPVRYIVQILKKTSRLVLASKSRLIPRALLKQLDVLDAVRSYSIQPDNPQLRSYQDAITLSRLDLVPYMEDTYGAPWLLIHRANFQEVLAAKADSMEVDILLGCSVSKDVFSNLYVSSASGDVELHADAIIGGDGLHSIWRTEVQPGTLRITGDIAYRVTIKAENIRQHENLVPLLGSPNINAWMGPRAHVVSYVLKGTGLYTFVFICRTRLDRIEDMREF